jgi:hypothetical protein
MSHFKVTLNGSGIAFPIGDQVAVGFFTTRKIRAANAHEARSKAREVVASEWSAGGVYAQANTGTEPILTIENVLSLSLLGGLISRSTRGYSFYATED